MVAVMDRARCVNSAALASRQSKIARSYQCDHLFCALTIHAECLAVHRPRMFGCVSCQEEPVLHVRVGIARDLEFVVLSFECACAVLYLSYCASC